MNAPASAPVLAPGTTVAGRYVLEERLGAGAFGEVWRAHDARAFNRLVAVKFLLGEHLSNRDVVARFRREGEATAALSHPNVVAMLEFGEEGGAPFLVSEFVPGKSLRDVLNERVESGRPLTAAEALGIFRQICAGVAAAHARGIVHRDLKPENVMVQGEGSAASVKVLDFGVARMQHGESSSVPRTEVGRIIGSPQYMSPEQITGDTAAIDHRADVFVLATILFELLTLAPPFEGASFHLVAIAVLTAPRPSVRARRPELPAALDTVLAAAFSEKIAERTGSVAELLAATERALADAPPYAAPRPSERAHPDAETRSLEAAPVLLSAPPSRPVRPRAHRAHAALTAFLVAFAAAGSGAALLIYLHAHDARPTATPPPSPIAPPREAPAVHATPPAVASARPAPAAAWVSIAAPARRVRLGRDAPRGGDGFSPRANVAFAGPGFAIQAREVTFGEYEAWARGRGADAAVRVPSWVPAEPAQRAALPAVGVPWDQAKAYCEALGGALPTEEQWEFTARASERRRAPWATPAPPRDVAAFGGPDARLREAGVMSGDRTPEGVLDLAGNAQEWTASPFRTDDGAPVSWPSRPRAIRGLPLREYPPHRGWPPAALFRNAGCTAAPCSDEDRAALEGVGFRCVR